MKTTIVLFASIIMLNSCKSQNNIDLLDLSLPLNKEVLINEKYNVEEEEPYAEAKYYGATSTDPELLYVSGENISNLNTISKDEKPSKIAIFISAKTHKIIGYRLKNSTTKETKKIEKILEEKYNKPQYNESDKISEIKIWEDKKNKVLYLFGHYYPSDTNNPHGCDLYAFNVDETQIAWDLGPAQIQYYLNYIKKRKEKKDPNYSYRDFAEEKAENYDTRYLRAIDNVYKH